MAEKLARRAGRRLRCLAEVARGPAITALLAAALAAPAATPLAAPVPDPAMARRMAACSPCHGPEGRATSEGYFPRIAGKPAGYLFNQLVNFREGRRPNSAMADLVEHLDDAYLRDIAGYFAALDLPYAPPPARAATPAVLSRGERLARMGDMTSGMQGGVQGGVKGDEQRGVPACTACHGERLTGVLPSLPGLVGLPRDYLLAQLGAWRQGERRAAEPDCMATIARRLDPADIEAVTRWIASQPPGADMKPAAAETLKRPLPLACGSAPP